MVAETQQIAESAGALGALGVDIKLFLAQLVNFGVVLFVMWKWVYTPLLKVMDERTGKIEQGLKDAAASAEARLAAERDRDGVLTEAKKHARAILEQAAAAAESERQESAKRARAEVEKIVEQGREQLRGEKAKLLAEVKAEAADLVATATERIIREKLDPKKDGKLIRESLEGLERTV